MSIQSKTILEQPLTRLAIAAVVIGLFLYLIFWGLSTQYHVDEKDSTINICFINCKQNGNQDYPGIISPPPDKVVTLPSQPQENTIIITPVSASVIAGGVSTIGLTLLIGLGFLDFPIVLALAGGAAFASATYTVIQTLY